MGIIEPEGHEKNADIGRAHDQKTIEGDLFKAFVAAGAISKANATDPKKSSFVRCARTDKGVHAAGNIISLKLIVEDNDIVEKINQNLGPRIRVWGYERTNNAFSAYQMCDSRIYEYLIPTHSFLPPHPSSYLGRKIVASAKEMNDEEGLSSRQEEVSGFWQEVDAGPIEDILASHDQDTRQALEEILYFKSDSQAKTAASRTEKKEKYVTKPRKPRTKTRGNPMTEQETFGTAIEDTPMTEPETISTKVHNGHATGLMTSSIDTQDKSLTEREASLSNQPDTPMTEPETISTDLNNRPVTGLKISSTDSQDKPSTESGTTNTETQDNPVTAREARQSSHRAESPMSSADPVAQEDSKSEQKKASPYSEGLREIRAAYLAARRSYRISEARLKRVQDCLSLYEGSQNYHNFTVDKSYRDPSALRLIKSFVLNPTPILIDGTEWLSIKVHGQSFMMHQIRKMVGMVALVVRAGCDPQRIKDAFGEDSISIPKAPSLGLLLERPVFDNYNKRAKNDYGKEPLKFDKYETELNAFKQKEIYERIYQDEQSMNL